MRPGPCPAALLALAVGWGPGPQVARAAETFRVVVHPSNPATSLDAGKVADFFVRRAASWPDGTAVEPVDQRSERRVREAFSSVVHHRSAAAIQSFWQRQIFSGGAVPPPELGDDAEVLALVRDRRGAIGYVSPSAALSGVKAVDVVGAPRALTRAEPEYPSTARRARIEGRVVLEVSVAADGRLLTVEPIERLPMGLTDAAVVAVRGWTFEAGSRNGEPIEATTTVAIHFEL